MTGPTEVGTRPAPTVPQLRAALAETCMALADLAATLDDAQWELPTPCPGWNVRDQVAHVASLEAVLSGEPLPDQEAPAAPHVRNSAGALMERLVHVRRNRSADDLIAELRSVTELRQQQLEALGDDPDRSVPGIMGREVPLADLLSLRVFDCYAHEQDVRRAVGASGHLDGPVAEAVRVRIADILTQIWTRAGAGAGARLVVDGMPLLTIGEPVDVTLAMSFDDLVRITTGRSDARPETVSVEGDPDLGQTLLTAATGFTP